MDKAKEIGETPAQRALKDAWQLVDDLERRWRAVQQGHTSKSVEAAQADSFQRSSAVTMANVDTGVAFAAAREKLTEQTAAGGQHGGQAHVPSLAGSEAYQATARPLPDVVADQAVGDIVTPEARARVLAEHLSSIGSFFHASERLLAGAEQAISLSEQLAGGQIRWPDGPAGDELRAAVTQAVSTPVQLEVLRSVAQSMAKLSELASLTIRSACEHADMSGASVSTGAGGAVR